MSETQVKLCRAISAYVVSAVFLYASAFKLHDPMQFALDIKHFKLLPFQLVNITAIVLPWLELLSGGAILLPAWRRSACILLMSLCAVFSVAVTIAIVRGLDISCGCFGNNSTSVGAQTLALDLALLCACLFVYKGCQPGGSKSKAASNHSADE